MNTIPFTLSISLFDSFSTTQQIIIFALMLTTIKPLRNGIAYLAGLSGSYFAMGFGGYLVLDQLREFLGKYFPSTANIPNNLYYKAELLTGIIMIMIGIWYFRKKRNAPPGRSQNMIIAKLRSMNGFFAFVTGVIISVSCFPASVPYILALGKYSSLHLSYPAAIGNILLYNVGYALPMIAILIVYLYARSKAGSFSGIQHQKIHVLNVHLTTWTLVLFGIFSMIDAGCFFAIGHALVKGRFL
jgi:cytochrome c biogenesis protein CcdA